ncbi:MAG: DUF4394 domain-containing protein [Fibrella sp.]|nr:DUF4394 domain-containing protein [Armatimonadota bacterium]
MMLTHTSALKFSLIAFLATATVIGVTSSSRAEPLVGLTISNSLVTFDSATPNLISANPALFGFDGAGENAVSIDYRPIPGTPLTVLTVGQVDSDDATIVGRLYDVDATSGLLSNGRILTASFSTAVTYTIDFNPTGPVALRIVGSDNSNYRVTNPVTGATTVDTALTGTGIPAIGVAYTNNDNDPLTTTTLLNVDRAGDRLSTIAAPNGGVTAEFVNTLGIDLSNTGFQEIDISGSGVAFGVFQLQGQGNVSRLYSLNLATGAATPTAVDNRLRFNNTNIVVRGIAAAPSIVPENNTMALLAAGLTFGGILVRRRKISK